MGAFLPAVAAFGSALGLVQVAARGEARALAALGVSPFRRALGARWAGWLVGACAIGLLVSSSAGVGSLFPVVSKLPSWVAHGSAFLDPAHGVIVESDGQMRFVRATLVERASFIPSAWAALLAVAPLAVLLPIWVGVPLRRAWRLVGGALTFTSLVVLLHGVASARIGPSWLVAAAWPLAVQAALTLLWSRA
jgi:hypothetical protein